MEKHKSLLLSNCILAFLIFFCNAGVGDDDPGNGYHREERDALLSIRNAFNHTRLNREWNGLQCFMNEQKGAWFGISCKDGRVTGISLEGLGLTGQLDGNALVNLTQLTHLSFKNNSISGSLMDFSANGRLTHVDLSNNVFKGPISASLVKLDLLESLQLQNNFLSGPIPSFEQASLRDFNVSHNNLSGKIPNTAHLQSFSELSYSENPDLCGQPTQMGCPIPSAMALTDQKTPEPFHWSSLTGTFVLFGIVGLALVMVLILNCYRNMKPHEREELGYEVEIEEKEMIKVEEKRPQDTREQRGGLSFVGEEGGFELGDLLKASADGLGKGNFGYSYKVILENRPAVVVKRLRALKPLTREEFAEQIRLLANLKHPNLLPLLAYYHSNDEKLLVYKFMRNGNLFGRLHGGRDKNRIPFTWKPRLLVAQGVARAMVFLHRQTKAQNAIPHGNLKSSNVLLDDNNVALVTDYGFISLIAATNSVQHMVTYKSPEYQHRREISSLSDVWSFGLLLLELITGRVSGQSAPQGVHGMDLGNWAHKAVREEWTAEIFDVEVRASEGALKLLQIALRCCNMLPEKRPEMEEVMRGIEDIVKSNISDDDRSDSSEQSSVQDSS